MTNSTPNDQPLVSVGMPLFNAERYLSIAIDALLVQDHPNLEIIFSDDASTDQTPAICQEYVSRDARCRYVRNDTNLGAAGNFNHVFKLSNGEFFMWASHDDVRHNTYIRRCLDVLLRHPAAVMCCTNAVFIDEFGERLNRETTRPPIGGSVVERVNALTSVTDWIDVYGLLRRDALLATHGFQAQFGGDVILTMELCLNGDVMHIPEQLWSVRIFTNKTASEQAQTIIPFQAKKCLAVSYSDLSASFLRTISYAKLPFRQRFPALIRCLYNCSVSNPTLRYLIARDRSRPVHRAWKEKRYGDVLSLAILAMFVFFARALNRLRAPRINLER